MLEIQIHKRSQEQNILSAKQAPEICHSFI